MLRYSIFSLCLAALLMTAAVSQADEAEIFRGVDGNNDGQITKDEVDEKHQRLFDRLLRTSDENEDGKISQEEFIAGVKKKPADADGPANQPDRGRGQFDPQQFFRRLDRNGDDKLSKEEAPERIRERFDRIDGNSDGFIDGAEFERLAAAMRAQAGGGKQPQPQLDGQRLQQMADRIFKERDANQDGKVTVDEVPEQRREGYRRLLQQFDVGEDEGLTKEQFTKALGRLMRQGNSGPANPRNDAKPENKDRPRNLPPLEQLLQRVQAADTDNDGKISREEAPEKMRQFFDRIDGDSDGFLDESEIRNMIRRQQAD